MNTSVQLRHGNGGGLVLLQDTQLIETLAHFPRERIPRGLEDSCTIPKIYQVHLTYS